MNPLFARLLSDNEQNRAECDDWWEKASHQDKTILCDAILILCDPKSRGLYRLIGRFALVAFLDALEKEYAAKGLGRAPDGE